MKNILDMSEEIHERKKRKLVNLDKPLAKKMNKQHQQPAKEDTIPKICRCYF